MATTADPKPKTGSFFPLLRRLTGPRMKPMSLWDLRSLIFLLPWHDDETGLAFAGNPKLQQMEWSESDRAGGPKGRERLL